MSKNERGYVVFSRVGRQHELLPAEKHGEARTLALTCQGTPGSDCRTRLQDGTPLSMQVRLILKSAQKNPPGRLVRRSIIGSKQRKRALVAIVIIAGKDERGMKAV